MLNEYNMTNAAMAKLLPVEQSGVWYGTNDSRTNATIFFAKQDLPYAERLDEVTILDHHNASQQYTLGVFGDKSIFTINSPPPAPTPPPTPSPKVICDPTAKPPEVCPGNHPCPKCGKTSCVCPPPMRLTIGSGVHVLGNFGDGSPAVVNVSVGTHGGGVTYAGFHLGFSYFQPGTKLQSSCCALYVDLLVLYSFQGT